MAAPASQDSYLKIVGSVQSYMESGTDYVRLQVFKALMRMLTSLAKSTSVGVFITLGVLFLTLGGTLVLGEWLGSYPLAFVLTGLIYLLVGLCIYLLRGRIDRYVLESFSDLYWNP